MLYVKSVGKGKHLILIETNFFEKKHEKNQKKAK